MKAKKTTIPEKSIAKQFFPANYEDTFMCIIPSDSKFDYSPDDLQVAFWTSSPKWIKSLFKIRDSIVSLFGLKVDKKDMKKLEECIRNNSEHEVFSVAAKNEHETVLRLTDKHLCAYMSILIDNSNDTTSIYAITIVHIHNTLGKMYFYTIQPFHTMVVKGMMKYTINRMLDKK